VRPTVWARWCVGLKARGAVGIEFVILGREADSGRDTGACMEARRPGLSDISSAEEASSGGDTEMGGAGADCESVSAATTEEIGLSSVVGG